jgi:hypothetical protein
MDGIENGGRVFGWRERNVSGVLDRPGAAIGRWDKHWPAEADCILVFIWSGEYGVIAWPEIHSYYRPFCGTWGS